MRRLSDPAKIIESLFKPRLACRTKRKEGKKGSEKEERNSRELTESPENNFSVHLPKRNYANMFAVINK
jgi:hypothetical protein